jgi:hypothetical protein
MLMIVLDLPVTDKDKKNEFDDDVEINGDEEFSGDDAGSSVIGF